MHQRIRRRHPAATVLALAAMTAAALLRAEPRQPPAQASHPVRAVYPDARPYVRWWWFSGAVTEDGIRHQLTWLQKNGFGGVEIAFVYPLGETSAGPKWLSPEWSRLTAVARRTAQELGLGCDFTFGTLWPFGDSQVSEQDGAWTFSGPSPQRIRRSWEHADEPPSRIINHLDRQALERYARRIGGALRDSLGGRPPALFCDSWEVEPQGLWSPGLDAEFQARFGYDLRPLMAELDRHPDVRYDYRKFIAEVIIREFYAPFTEICRNLGAVSRAQCLGAPTDLLAAYAAVDVPEAEAVLFDPQVAQIAASAAILAGNPLVSAEAFTCLYGWRRWPGPGPLQKQEQVADLKLVADALLANGVNLLVWHGMPYNGPGQHNQFYASVHVGPDSAFAADLPAFNRYLRNVSEKLRGGRPYTDLAVYLPLEDNWMRHELPEDLRRPSALHHWELQYERFPDAVRGYRPTWVTTPFLAQAQYRNGALAIGGARFSALYIDVEWLDREALAQVLRLARQGLPICLVRAPRQPGKQPVESYATDLAALRALPNVKSALGGVVARPPLLTGEQLPEYWVREDNGELLIFFAHPLSRTIRYPLTYGQSYSSGTEIVPVVLNYGGSRVPVQLRFAPNQSLLLRVDRKGGIRWEDIEFVCPVPSRTPRTSGPPAQTQRSRPLSTRWDGARRLQPA
jgi:hypothetical protein